MNILTTGTSNVVVGYNAGVAIGGGTNIAIGYSEGDYESKDHFVVLTHIGVLMCDIYWMLLNDKKRVKVTINTIPYSFHLPEYYIDDHQCHHPGKIKNIRDAIKRYCSLLPKWMHMYKYLVTANMLQNPDIFQHLFLSYYILTIS
ncbi:MAG TPA: hypothetical protein VLG50_05680 [Candidatus Saccharimonadales bacterium]|nr:hypothetical protein [Candidatus Saccharimonadales bacterium]